jgi:hypothetical protein
MRHQNHRPDGASPHAPAFALVDTAGLSPPEKSETPELAGGGRFWDQSKSNDPDCAGQAADDQHGDAVGKTLATLRARLALSGWALLQNEGSDGTSQFLATRWGHGRNLRDLAAVEAFARQVGAPC